MQEERRKEKKAEKTEEKRIDRRRGKIIKEKGT